MESWTKYTLPESQGLQMPTMWEILTDFPRIFSKLIEPLWEAEDFWDVLYWDVLRSHTALQMYMMVLGGAWLISFVGLIVWMCCFAGSDKKKKQKRVEQQQQQQQHQAKKDDENNKKKE